jgi:PPIC-type PPIASE domain
MAEQTATKKAPLTPDEVIASQRSRQLTIMAVVLLVLAGAIAVHRWGNRTVDKPPGSVALVGFREADVAALEIFSGAGGDKVKLMRDGEAWRLGNRFGALADKDDAAALIKKVVDAKRLDRPATEESARFALFDLTYEQAAHVVFTDKQGKELVHLLVGKGTGAAADFIRYSAKDAPAGVFELVDSAGVMETLRSRLHLDAEGKPEVRTWLDTTAFKTLNRESEVERLVIHDKGGHIEMESAPDPGDATKRIWSLIKPEPAYGNSATIDGAIEALRTLRGADVAGKPVPQGTELGVTKAERWVEVKYGSKAAGKSEIMRFDFGKLNDKEVALWVSSEKQGELIWWVNEYVLSRVFRPLADFVDVAPLPPPGPAVTERAVVTHILISFTGTGVPTKQPRTRLEARKLALSVMEQAQGAGDWKALQLQHNEDAAPHTEYPVEKNDTRWDKNFSSGALSLKVGEVGLFETQFGYHIIKRVE